MPSTILCVSIGSKIAPERVGAEAYAALGIKASRAWNDSTRGSRHHRNVSLSRAVEKAIDDALTAFESAPFASEGGAR